MNIFLIISTIATCVIAYYAFESHNLTRALMLKDKHHKQEINDLYRAIVISNLFCAGESTDTKMKSFKDLYTGKTKIF